MNTREIGRRGELIAEKYLLWKNYKILYKNWYCRWGELDLICTSPPRGLIFVEVKYVRASQNILPESLFTKKKKEHLLRTINYFLKSHRADTRWHMDLICIRGNIPSIKINYYEDAYML